MKKHAIVERIFLTRKNTVTDTLLIPLIGMMFVRFVA